MQNSLFQSEVASQMRPLRPRQLQAIAEVRDAIKAGHKRIILQAPTGFGKCHGAGTEVVMFDGSLRKAEDVRTGDLLMGPDSDPRTVLNTVHGYGPLYVVTPNKGEPFVCNDVHVLSLKQTRFWQENGAGGKGNWYGGRIVNIPLNEYLGKSRTFRHQYKLWRTGVEFESKDLPLDPYVLGVLIGDGSMRTMLAVTTMDPEIVSMLHALAPAFGLTVRKVEQKDNRSSVYHLTSGPRSTSNPLRKIIRSLGLNVACGDKFIPHLYKTASREQRLELLAGLIDTDGHVFPNQKSIEFSNKSLRVIEDFEFLVRSLGFGCARCQTVINGVTYYRVHIHGDYTVIPTRIERKKVTKSRLQKKDVLMSGFSVEFIGNGDYYGFALDGDSLYLLRDFTVTHNTLVSAHIIAAALRKDSRPLFTCPAISLVDQTLTAFEKEGIRDIGVMQAQHIRTNRNATVQIASVQTLIRRVAPDVDFALIDEAHESFDGLEALLDSEEWKNKIVIGLSATPWAKGMGLRWTKLVIAATINDLIADGHATPAVIYGPEKDVDRGSIKIVKGEFDEAGSAAAMSDDAIVGDVLKEWKEKSPREKTFVFCVNRAHAQTQMEAFLDDGIPFGYIDANTPQDERKRQFKQMRYGEIAGIASVGCLIRGVDEDVRCIVDLQLTKSEIRHVQKWGRGVRTAEGKEVLIGLDHAGNNAALGLFTDIYHDHLDIRRPGERGESYKDDYKPAKPKKCGKCHNLIPPKMRNCPSCNERVPLNTGVTVVDGRLVEIGSGPKINVKERQEWYSGLLWLAKQQNRKDGWAAHGYREKFGEWPKHLRVRAKKPSEAVVDFTKQRREEYLKRIAVPVAAPAEHEERLA